MMKVSGQEQDAWVEISSSILGCYLNDKQWLKLSELLLLAF